jgi:hypothetical protein
MAAAEVFVRVQVIERVTVDAVGLACVRRGGSDSAQDVLSPGDSFEMGGVHAGAITAQVVDVPFPAGGNGSPDQLVDSPMGVTLPELSVPP